MHLVIYGQRAVHEQQVHAAAIGRVGLIHLERQAGELLRTPAQPHKQPTKEEHTQPIQHKW